jgi:hypothetical protein
VDPFGNKRPNWDSVFVYRVNKISFESDPSIEIRVKTYCWRSFCWSLMESIYWCSSYWSLMKNSYWCLLLIRWKLAPVKLLIAFPVLAGQNRVGPGYRNSYKADYRMRMS